MTPHATLGNRVVQDRVERPIASRKVRGEEFFAGQIAGDPEWRLILECARLELEPPNLERIPSIIRAGIDWHRLPKQARGHGMTAFLYRHLKALGGNLVPDEVLASLREESWAIAAMNLAMTRELTEILDSLEETGVPTLAFKGPAVAVAIYGSLALRPFVDLDVVIERKNLELARDTLISRGYAPAYDFTPAREDVLLHVEGAAPFAHKVTGTIVELHWRFMPKHFRSGLLPQQVIERCTWLNLQGTWVRVPCDEDLLLLLCDHGSKHAWACLEWLCSIAELVRSRSINWDRALVRASDAGSLRRVLLGLALAGDMLELPLHEAVVRAIEREPEIARLASRLKATLPSGEDHPYPIDSIDDHRVFLQLQDHWWDRVRYVSRRILSPTVTEGRAFQVPRGFEFLYRIIRPWRLIAKYVLKR